ncbi:MAG: CPBP family intramembrane metalloprotease [Planctomycetes bacterium]|nr:CPBP family intramembrane metalloprotease [Planctomycetota bacterium]
MPNPPGALRVMWLLACTAVRKIANRTSGNLNKAFNKRKKPDAPPEKRQATPRKKAVSVLLMLFVGAMFMFNGVNLSSQFVRRLGNEFNRGEETDKRIAVRAWTLRQLHKTEGALKALDASEGAPDNLAQVEKWRKHLRESFEYDLRESRLDGSEREAMISERIQTFDRTGAAGFRVEKRAMEGLPVPTTDAWPDRERVPGMLMALGAIMALMVLSVLFMSLGSGNQDLGKVEWSMEWLFTFPVPSRVIFLAKVFEYTLANPFTWFLFFPFFFVLQFSAGFLWWSVPLAACAALYAGLLAGAARVFLETFLRKTFALNRVKNFQAVFTLLGILLFFVVIGASSSQRAAAFAVRTVPEVPAAALWNPLSVPALLCDGAGLAWPAAGAMLLYGAALAGGVVYACEWLVRDGLTITAGVYAGKRSAATPVERGAGRMRGIVGKELRLLFRDRNFLVQTLIVPLLLIGFNLFMNSGLMEQVGAHFRHAAALAFGLGAYVLMFSAFQVLSVESSGLWMLYTFPRSLERILFEKTVLWCGFAMLYAVSALLGFALVNPALDASAISDAVMAVVGVGIYAFIAAGIGILATDALETEAQRKIRPDMMYLYMLLASLYGFAIYSPSLWAKLAQLVLSGLLAFALWQKVRDHTPYLLDPTQEPPPRIALADGLIAVLAFFVLQGLAMIGLHFSDLPPGAQLLFAFVLAGLLVALFTLYAFWRHGVPDLLAAVGLRAAQDAPAGSYLRAVKWGLVCGTCAALFGAFYLYGMEWFEPLRALKREALALDKGMDPGVKGWFAILAVCAAPLFEEYIFRGLVFRGLRRSTTPLLAVLGSAGVFALIHPPLSVVPVFVLGVAAAVSFEASGLLLAPILTHALYNAVVVWLNFT